MLRLPDAVKLWEDITPGAVVSHLIAGHSVTAHKCDQEIRLRGRFHMPWKQQSASTPGCKQVLHQSYLNDNQVKPHGVRPVVSSMSAGSSMLTAC